MNESDLLNNAVPSEEYALGRLQHWLQYGKHSWSVGAGIFWLPYSLVILVFSIIAYLFTPYMLYQLYKAQWYKSVAALTGIVVVPFMISKFSQTDNATLDFLMAFFPYVAFYFFTYAISYMINERLTELQTLRRWKREERTKHNL